MKKKAEKRTKPDILNAVEKEVVINEVSMPKLPFWM